MWVALQFRKYAMAVWQCGSCMRDNGKVPFPYRHWNLLPISNISILMNATQLCCVLPVLGWWKTIKSNREERAIWKLILKFREEKEKSEFHFPSSEKRKRNQTKYYPLSRREREMYFLCSSFEKRTFKYICPILRGEREYWNNVLLFWELNYKGRGKPRVISLRQFLELKTLVKVWLL